MSKSIKIEVLKEQAKGHWLSIFSALAPTSFAEAISKKNKHVACPVHGGKDGFRFFDDVEDTGGAVCNTCGRFTDGIAFLSWANGWEVRHTLEQVNEYLNGPQSHQLPRERGGTAPAPKPTKDLTYVVNKILDSTTEEPTEPVMCYMASRGLEDIATLPKTIRSARSLSLYINGKVEGTYPALIAPVTKGNQTVGITRLNLTPEGNKLYKTFEGKNVKPKQMLGIDKGVMSGGAVKFNEATDVLHVGEGIETMLAIWHSVKEPTWACCTAALMSSVEVPEHTKTVYVWADKDRAGIEASQKLKERLETQGKTVYVLVPPFPGSTQPGQSKNWDWLDVYNFKGSEALTHAYKNAHELKESEARTAKKVLKEAEELQQPINEALEEIEDIKLQIAEAKETAALAESKEEEKAAKITLASLNTKKLKAEHKYKATKRKQTELKTEQKELRQEEIVARNAELLERTNDPSYTPTFSDDDKDTVICEWMKSTPIMQKNAYEAESDQFYNFNGRYWQDVHENKFMREVDKAMTIAMPDGYDSKKLNSVTKMLKIRVPEKPERNKELVGFSNGVFNLKKRTFSPHHAAHGLLSCSDVIYDENQIECPNFMKWLASAAQCATEEETDAKRQLIGALFYYAVFRKTEWTVLFEVVGEGGTGKSVLLDILSILCGKDNIVSASINSIEGEGFGLEPLINKSVLIIPEADKYTGDGKNLKAITGNDPIEISRKYKTAITTKLEMPVVIVGNQPMNITDKSSGLYRRRIVIRMDNVIPDNEKDYMLSEKLKQEASAIMNWLLLNFDDETVLETIEKAKNNKEKLQATAQGDALFSWILDAVEFLDHPEAITKIGGSVDEKLRSSQVISTQLYANYQQYAKYHGFKQQLSIVKFSEAVLSAAHRKLDKPYTFVRKAQKKGKGMHLYGIKVNLEAEHYIQMLEDENLNRYSLDSNQSF